MQSDEKSSKDWLVWQFVDSAFPTGGFAHSGGLEAAAQHGAARSAAEVEQFIRTNLLATARTALPLTVASFADAHRLPALDRLCDAILTNHIAHRASKAQGQALMLAMEKAFPSPAFSELLGALRDQQLTGHFAPLLGASLALLGIERLTAGRVVIFLSMRSVISAAVRLNLLGPLAAQHLQGRLAPLAEALVGRYIDTAVEDIAHPAPLADLFLAAHDRLYLRLFQT